MTQVVIRPIELRRTITAAIRTITEKVYYEDAPSEPDYPYIVYVFPDTDDQESLETFMMEIDAWDKPSGNGTLAIEELIGKVDKVLNRKVFSSNGVFFSIYRESRRSINDPDKNIKRRQYEYQIRVMGE